MKIIIISLLLFITVNAQTIWYVDRDATGANTGRSWTDAWNYFDSSSSNQAGINWAIITGGDSIYVSGGTDSTEYRPSDALYGEGLMIGMKWQFEIDYYFDDWVVIAPAWQSGHNGDVWYIVENGDPAYPFEFKSMSHVKLTGFKMEDRRTVGSAAGALIIIGSGTAAPSFGYEPDSLQWIDNWELYGNGNGEIVTFSGSKGSLTNSYLQHKPNTSDNGQDMVSMNSGRGGHTIANNVLVKGCYNNITTEAHADMIQISNVGSSVAAYDNECLTITVTGNLCIDTAATMVAYNGMIYASGMEANQRLHVCNNIFVNRNARSSISGIYIGQGLFPEYNNYCEIINNTVLIKGAESVGVPLTYWDWDSLHIYNNLLVLDTTISGGGTSKLTNGRSAGDVTANYGDIDYNFWSIKSGTYRFFDFGDYMTLDQWWASSDNGGLTDEHGDTLTYSTLDLTERHSFNPADYYTTAGRDLGYTIPEWLCNHPDILGNPRSGTWDIGALEYQDGAADTIPSFSFTALNNMELNTAYVGSSTFSGADSTFTVYTTTGARFNINSSSSLSTTPKTATNGDVVYVETLTGMSYSTGYSETIIAGGVSQNFTVTTKAEPYVPPSGNGILKGSNGKILRDSTGKVIRTQ